MKNVRRNLSGRKPVLIDGGDILQKRGNLRKFERLIPKMKQLKGLKNFTSGSFRQ